MSKVYGQLASMSLTAQQQSRCSVLFQHVSVLQRLLQQVWIGPGIYPASEQSRSCGHMHMAYTIVKRMLSVCVAHASLQLLLWYGLLVCSAHV